MKMKHITISTAKLQESVNFYEAFCGLTVQRKIEQPGHNIVFLANGEGETCVELILEKEEGKIPSLICLPVSYACGGTTLK